MFQFLVVFFTVGRFHCLPPLLDLPCLVVDPGHRPLPKTIFVGHACSAPLLVYSKVVRLTVDQWHGRGGGAVPPTADDEANGALVPPLDLVIRTKWPAAFVDWNGTDPIL